MSTIRVLSVIDCDSIINNGKVPVSTNPSSPTSLGSYQTSDAYVYMMVTQSYLINDGGKSELTIQASVGDSVQWTITSIDGGLQYNAILQGITPNTTKAITAPVSIPLSFSQWIGAPQPSALTAISYTDYILQATVENTNAGNQIQYYVTFYITDTNGNILGYYSWDPFINVVN